MHKKNRKIVPVFPDLAMCFKRRIESNHLKTNQKYEKKH